MLFDLKKTNPKRFMNISTTIYSWLEKSEIHFLSYEVLYKYQYEEIKRKRI